MATKPADQRAADTAAFLSLVQAQAAIQARVTAQATALATSSARSFGGWYDTQAITAWSAALAVQMRALLKGVAGSTDAYMARALSMLAGSRIRPVGAVDVTGLRNGVTDAGAYARAADVYRWQQAQFDAIAKQLLAGVVGNPGIVDPIEAAVQRVADVADLNTQLATRAQETAALTAAADRGIITGYRRVIHPEVSKGGTCGLCVAASDRLYGATEPRAIHKRCACTTLPVLDHLDPGSALNAGDLSKLYSEADGTGRQALAATRFQIDEHGELGAVLNPAGAKVRTARDARRDENRRPRRPKSGAQRAADLERLHRQLSEALPKVAAQAEQSPEWADYLTKFRKRLEQLEEAA